MSEDEPEPVDAEVVAEEPAPDMAPAIDEMVGSLVIHDPGDEHESMIVLDNHDMALFLAEVQTAALRKWVYVLPGRDGAEGLTIHATQDIVQRMNWKGWAQIGVLPETLKTEQLTADEGNGPEAFWVATIFAIDKKTGSMQPGVAMEPQKMKLKAATAKKKRDEGIEIPPDNKVFDRYALSKAVQKATRNALQAFIPEEVKQTVIGMFKGDASRVERIRTEREAEVEKLPPPIDDDEMRTLIAKADAIYDEIKEAGAGQGKVKMPPGYYNAGKLRVQHSHDRMRDFIVWLEGRLAEIPVELAREALEREAVDTATNVRCPTCEAEPRKFCKNTRGSHPERVLARLEQLKVSA